MSVAVENVVDNNNSPSSTPSSPVVEGKKASMMASAPPMEPPPLPENQFVVQTLEGDQLKETLVSLVDYFLSRSYLEGDPYMVSQMNADRFLPVNLIVEKISFLVGPVEQEDVISTITASKDLVLDDTKQLVRPNIKLSRNTVILRELPGIDADGVKELFAKNEALPVPTEVTKEIGENWFVSFETEDQALLALSFIRKQTHNGVAVAARLKQESLSRNSYTFDPVAMPYYAPTPKGENADPSAHPGNHPWDPNSDSHRGAHDSKDHRRRFDRKNRAPRRGREFNNGQQANTSGGANASSSPAAGQNASGGANATNASGAASGSGSGEGGQGRHGYGHRNRRNHAGGQGRKRVNSGKRGAPASINLGLAHFPPLNAQEKSQGQKVSQSIKKLSKSDIVAVIKALGEPCRPSTMPDCIAVSNTPNTSLELAKPMPKVETVELPQKPKQAPDYKAVVSAKPAPNNTPKQEKKNQGKGKKAEEKSEEGEGKKKGGEGGAKKGGKKGRGKGGDKGKGGNKDKDNKDADKDVKDDDKKGEGEDKKEEKSSPKGGKKGDEGEKKEEGGEKKSNPMSWASRINKAGSPTPSSTSSSSPRAASPEKKEGDSEPLSASS